MEEEKRKYEMEECKECEIEGKNATNGYDSGEECNEWLWLRGTVYLLGGYEYRSYMQLAYSTASTFSRRMT